MEKDLFNKIGRTFYLDWEYHLYWILAWCVFYIRVCNNITSLHRSGHFTTKRENGKLLSKQKQKKPINQYNSCQYAITEQQRLITQHITSINSTSLNRNTDKIELQNISYNKHCCTLNWFHTVYSLQIYNVCLFYNWDKTS